MRFTWHLIKTRRERKRRMRLLEADKRIKVAIDTDALAHHDVDAMTEFVDGKTYTVTVLGRTFDAN